MRRPTQAPARRTTGRIASLAMSLAALWLAACVAPPPPPPPEAEPALREVEVEVYRRAETDRAARLAREVEELRADLEQAEAALVAAESGLRGSFSRADAVSSLAEARIRLARARRAAPWRNAELDEARAKLDDADLQVAAGNFGAALFFVYRAERIADTLEAEAARVHRTPGARFVRVGRVNLRAGPSMGDPVLDVLTRGTPVFQESGAGPWVLVRTPSGKIGWVHASLIASIR